MPTNQAQNITSEKTCQVKKCDNREQSCLIYDEMEQLIWGIDEPIDDRVCENYECRHNIFWSALFEKQNYQESQWKPTPSRLSKSIRNCTCLLDGEEFHDENEIYEASNERAIAETYGVSRQNISVIIKRATKHLEKLLRARGINETDLN